MSAPTRTAQKERTRQRLLEATIHVVTERGYDDARMLDIAEAAGYSTGALQAHFGSKAGAVAEAAAYAIFECESDLFDGPPPDGTLDWLFGTLFECWLSPEWELNQRLITEIATAAVREEPLRTFMASLLEVRHEVIKDSLELARAEGELAPNADSESLAFILGSVLSGLAVRQLARTNNGPPPDELLDTLRLSMRQVVTARS